MDFQELFLKQKEVTRKRTRTIYPYIPRDRVHWVPAEGALSLGQLLRHVWHSEFLPDTTLFYRFCNDLLTPKAVKRM